MSFNKFVQTFKVLIFKYDTPIQKCNKNGIFSAIPIGVKRFYNKFFKSIEILRWEEYNERIL